MKSTLANMILCLLGVTLVCSAVVGGIYTLTEEPIAKAKAENITAALSEVLPEFSQSRLESLTVDGMPIEVYTALAADGTVVGHAVQTMTKDGFSGEFRLMVGFGADGTVCGIKVLEHSETPGLGSKMTEEGNPLLRSFLGRKPAEMNLKVTKDGGDVDALTAATISSRAYVDAVARAQKALGQQLSDDAAACGGCENNCNEKQEDECNE